MKTTTTTREYDEQGRLVKETVMETETPDAPAPALWTVCSCGTSTWCPTHGQQGHWWSWPNIICGGNGNAMAALS